MSNHITLQKLYEAMKIPLQLFDDTEPIQTYESEEFHPNPAISMISNAINSIHSVCYTVSPENLFCGLIRIHNSSQYLIVGPAMAVECTRNQAESILESLQQPATRTDEFLHWFRAIPICDLQRFRGILSYLDYILNGETQNEPVHIAYEVNPSPMLSNDTNPSFIEHVSDLLEKQMLSYIEYGKTNALEAVLNDMQTKSGGGVPLVAPDVVRSYKNIFIGATVLASRAAVKGGMDYDTANALSDMYLTQIEKINNFSEIFIFLKQMF